MVLVDPYSNLPIPEFRSQGLQPGTLGLRELQGLRPRAPGRTFSGLLDRLSLLKRVFSVHLVGPTMALQSLIMSRPGLCEGSYKRPHLCLGSW